MTPADIHGIIADTLATITVERAVIVGINGVDTSGKTRFTLALAQFLKNRGQATQIVHLDDFHHPKEIRSQGTDEIDAYINNAFNMELLITELLAPVHTGGSVDKTLHLLDLESDSMTNRKRYIITPDTIVLIEGILLYRPPLDSFFDYRVFLDIGFDEVMRRAAERDTGRFDENTADRYRRKYIPVQKWYLETHHPGQKADLVIDNTDWTTPEVIRQK